MALVARLGDCFLDFRRDRIEPFLDFVEGRWTIVIGIAQGLVPDRTAAIDALGELRHLPLDPLHRQRPCQSRRQKIADLQRLVLDILEGGGIDPRPTEIVELGAEPFQLAVEPFDRRAGINLDQRIPELADELFERLQHRVLDAFGARGFNLLHETPDRLLERGDRAARSEIAERCRHVADFRPQFVKVANGRFGVTRGLLAPHVVEFGGERRYITVQTDERGRGSARSGPRGLRRSLG